MNDDLCGEAKARIEQLTLERDKFLSGWNELRQELYHADVSILALQADNARLRGLLSEAAITGKVEPRDDAPANDLANQIIDDFIAERRQP